MDEIMLSIYIITWCHEKYIREALDSVLMQNTKYKYEVLIGEDASPDCTRNILKEYDEKYPNQFTMFYREKNMGAHDNSIDLQLRCRGKYVIALEGDDFWLDSDKIEKQIDFLETHPEYIAVAHNCLMVGEESKPNGEKYPECKDNEYTIAHFASEILPGQTTTVMYRNFNIVQFMDTSLLFKDLMPWDRMLYFTLLCNGRIYCMQECKSAYRHIIDSGVSFSATNQFDYTRIEDYYIALIEYATRIKHKEAIKVAKMLYIRNIIEGLRKKRISLKRAWVSFKKVDIGLSPLFLYIKQFINHNFTQKEIWILNKKEV